VCSEPSVMANEPTSLNDLPEEILLKIFSHFGAEDLSFIIAKVCKRWSILAKDKILWKTLSYSCGYSSDISRIAEVRCTACLGFSANWLKNFAPKSILKIHYLTEYFKITSFHPELKQVSRGLHCVTPSVCYF